MRRTRAKSGNPPDVIDTHPAAPRLFQRVLWSLCLLSMPSWSVCAVAEVSDAEGGLEADETGLAGGDGSDSEVLSDVEAELQALAQVLEAEGEPGVPTATRAKKPRAPRKKAPTRSDWHEIEPLPLREDEDAGSDLEDVVPAKVGG